jgi:hypothetical protein
MRSNNVAERVAAKNGMSAVPEADIGAAQINVRFGSKADIRVQLGMSAMGQKRTYPLQSALISLSTSVAITSLIFHPAPPL